MDATTQHTLAPDTTLDGGSLDCGGGLLLLIRRAIDPLPPGGLLEILSTEPTVEVELPAWSRMTGNELVSWTKTGAQRSFLVSKGPTPLRHSGEGRNPPRGPQGHNVSGRPERSRRADPAGACHSERSEESKDSIAQPKIHLDSSTPLRSAQNDIRVPPLSVMGIGSWPRPAWMLRAIHAHVEGRLSDDEFAETANDAVRLSAQAQIRAGAGVLTDGEQRRDNYVSFVGGLLDNCQLIPLTDLAAMVDDSEEFERELAALDVPASSVRHPVVYGRLARSATLAVHELEFAKGLADGLPVKVALPGPYLLTRTMWLDCLRESPYTTREELAEDVARVLREEAHHLLAAGASIVQFDEPVLTEVVHGSSRARRSFMCGALSERYDTATELGFAQELLAEVTRGLPSERLAMHVCRGNWTADESAALSGDYAPLIDLLSGVDVGTLFLELGTERAGEIDVLAGLPDDKRIGVGIVNPKSPDVEDAALLDARIRRAIDTFGEERVLLTPDCGFATFADNPVSSAAIAEAKLHAIVASRNRISLSV